LSYVGVCGPRACVLIRKNVVLTDSRGAFGAARPMGAAGCRLKMKGGIRLAATGRENVRNPPRQYVERICIRGYLYRGTRGLPPASRPHVTGRVILLALHQGFHTPAPCPGARAGTYPPRRAVVKVRAVSRRGTCRERGDTAGSTAGAEIQLPGLLFLDSGQLVERAADDI
jgi:hypothetical protein